MKSQSRITGVKRFGSPPFQDPFLPQHQSDKHNIITTTTNQPQKLLPRSTISTVLSDKHTDSTSTLSPNPTSHCHHSRHPCANFKPAAIGIAALTHNIKPPLYT